MEVNRVTVVAAKAAAGLALILTTFEYPVSMQVNDLRLEPLMDDQEFDARAATGTIYWEGAVRAFSKDVEMGRGYLELTGYWKPMKF